LAVHTRAGAGACEIPGRRRDAELITAQNESAPEFPGRSTLRGNRAEVVG
jgi:hypothetical protein